MKRSLSLSLFVVGALGRIASAQPADSPGPPAPAPVEPTPPIESPPPPVEPALPPQPPQPPQPPLVEPAPLPVAIAPLVEPARLPPPPDDGFYIDSRDGTSRLKVGGFIQFDGRFFANDSANTETNQFVFRSIRPDLQGTVFDHYDFRIYPDFAGGKLVVQDAYLDIHYGEAVKIRFGKFKVPFGLERLEQEMATTFVDRGLPTQLAPNRDLGVQVFGTLFAGVLEYEVGVFNGVADGQSGDGDVSDNKEAAARVFVLPFITGHSIFKNLGFGGATTFGDKSGTLAQTDVGAFKTQAQSTFFQYDLGTTLANTVIASGVHWRATGQGYWYAGPVGVLGEYVRSVEHVALGAENERATFDSWQLLGQWVLTGEDATYRSVTPAHPFDPGKGQWGAFDVAARVTELRVVDPSVFDKGFADPTVSSRRAFSVGGGLDWFPNRVVRFALDVDHTSFELGAKTGDRQTEISIIGRAQTYF